MSVRERVAMADENEWRENLFASLVDTPEIEALALKVARTLGSANDPEVRMADVTGARVTCGRAFTGCPSKRRRCSRASGRAAHLWARGALGAARYRARLVAPEGRRVAKGR
jgi:hypothetical protein